MNFDGTINLGTLLNIAAMLAGGLYFLWEVKAKLSILTNSHQGLVERLDKVDHKLEALGQTTIIIARQEERMAAQDGRIQELSNRFNDYMNKNSIKRKAS